MSVAGEIVTALNRFPYAGIETILDGKRPLILAPHADDESLGCGGLIAECCGRGVQPVVAILTDGAASHPGSKKYPPERLRQVRAREVHDAVTQLGLAAKNLEFLNYRDTLLPSNPAVIAQVVDLARVRGCTIILGPWIYDPHCDHEAAAVVARHAAAKAYCRLLSYPVWGWLLPAPTRLTVDIVTGWKLDISAHLPAKRNAIAAHASQYSDLIDDSPDGFRLPRELLSIFERPFEVFIDG